MGSTGIKIITMSFLKEIFSSGATTLVDSVGKVLDNVITTKEEAKQLDIEMKKAEMQYLLDDKRMSVEDTGNARNREIEIAKSDQATELSKNILPILAAGTVLLSFLLFFVLIFKPDLIPDRTKDIVIYILGVLSAVLTQIYSYYFGSSQGSAMKSDIIHSNISK